MLFNNVAKNVQILFEIHAKGVISVEIFVTVYFDIVGFLLD